MKRGNKILLITDIPGYGKVAMAAQVPILSKMGFDLYNLPTALVSNTLNYGIFDISITTEYMKNTIEAWKKLEFEFDAISIGFIGEQAQIPVIKEFVDYHRKRNDKLIVALDTIMGDDGSLYHGIEDNTIDSMRDLCHIVDYITPNWTEACFITGYDYQENVDRDFAGKIAEKLHKRTGSQVVITSIPLKDGMTMAVRDREGLSLVDYEELPIHMPGTGDIFSAVLLGNYLKGKSLMEATNKAAKVVKEMLSRSMGQKDKFHGVPIEQYLGEVEVC